MEVSGVTDRTAAMRKKMPCHCVQREVIDQDHSESTQHTASDRMDERLSECESDTQLQHKLVEHFQPSHVWWAQPINRLRAAGSFSCSAIRCQSRDIW